MSIRGKGREKNGKTAEKHGESTDNGGKMGKDYMYSCIEGGDIRIGNCGYIRHPSGFFTEKDIPDFDVLYIVSGSYSIEINERSSIYRAGELLVIAPGSLLSLRASEVSSQFYCHFSIGKSEKVFFGADFTAPGCGDGPGIGVKRAYRELIGDYIKKEQEFTGAALRLTLKLILLERVGTDGNDLTIFGEQKAVLPEPVWMAVRYIRRNIGESLSCEKIAGAVGFNPGYFSGYFKKYMGVTPYGYVNKVKMEAARHMVCETDKKMKEIAETLGFTDQFAFSRKFRQFFGVSPVQMRQAEI